MEKRLQYWIDFLTEEDADYNSLLIADLQMYRDYIRLVKKEL